MVRVHVLGMSWNKICLTIKFSHLKFPIRWSDELTLPSKGAFKDRNRFRFFDILSDPNQLIDEDTFLLFIIVLVGLPYQRKNGELDISYILIIQGKYILPSIS